MKFLLYIWYYFGSIEASWGNRMTRQTEARHPASMGLHQQAPAQILALLLDGQLAALGAVRMAVPSLVHLASAAAGVLRRGGRLGYAGAGSSGLMALADALEMAGTFGIAPDRTPVLFAGGAEALIHMRGSVEDDPALARADVEASGLGAGDLVLVLTASGTTPYALEVARLARDRGVQVAGFANVPGAPLFDLSDYPVLLQTGSEVITGSTRMGAATAQKAALNMLSSLIGVQLGHVHHGHMVNLVADNAKLVGRAARIVADLARVDRGAAEAALAATGGAVKPAVLVARGESPARAQQILQETGGHLPDA